MIESVTLITDINPNKYYSIGQLDKGKIQIFIKIN